MSGVSRRVVRRLSLHGPPLDFRELCRRTVPAETRYLVLDLDRTVHLGWNMGELLGWELSALQGYGASHLAQAEDQRAPGRFFLDWVNPRGLARYLKLAVSVWARPGLDYLFWGKLARKTAVGRALQHLRFGSEPVQAVQLGPQMALLGQMAGFSADELQDQARRVWQRHRADQVIEREDLEWLRTRCPDITIILSSASPTPVVKVAADELGVDDVLGTDIATHGDAHCAPFRAAGSSGPEHIAPPSGIRLNAGPRKIDALKGRYPDMFEPGVLSVGMTDTGYGEDHAWAQHFDVVVDMNSSDPFPPIVRQGSPLREIHSAAVMTRQERDQRAGGEIDWSDPRRQKLPSTPARVLEGEELQALVAGELALLESLERRRSQMQAALHPEVSNLRSGIHRLLETIETTIVEARSSVPAALAPGRLRELLGLENSLRKQLAVLERPISTLSWRIGDTLERSRALLARPLGTVAGS